MQAIGKIIFCAPLAIVTDFVTGEQTCAQLMMRKQQLAEDPEAPPLKYHADPLIVIPDAMMVRTDDGYEIVTEATNREVVSLLWDTPMGDRTFCVDPQMCYVHDGNTMMRLA